MFTKVYFSLLLLLFIDAKRFQASEAHNASKKISTNTHQRYFSGSSQSITPKYLRFIKINQMQHLFTPSGLHYSSAMKVVPQFIKNTLCIKLLIILLLQFTQLFSLQRVAIYHGLKSLISTRQHRLCLMLCLYMLINFNHFSYMSFLFSALYLGIFILLSEHRIKCLIIASYFCALIFEQPISVMAPLTNMIMTFIYSLYYPLHFIAFLLYKSFEITLVIDFFNNFTDLLLSALQFVTKYIPVIKITSTHFVICLSLIFRKYKLFLTSVWVI